MINYITTNIRKKKASTNSYIIMSLICIILSIVNLDFGDIGRWDVVLCIIVQVCLLAYCFWCFKTKKINYIRTKEEYIEQWKQVKEGTCQ